MNSSSAMADHQHLMFSEIYLMRALCTHGIPTNTLAILYLGDSARIKKPAQNGVWAVLSNSFTSQILLKHYLHWAGLVQGYRENYMKILLLRSSQAGRKTRTKDENKAYHTRGGKWGLECKRHGPEGRAALLAEGLNLTNVHGGPAGPVWWQAWRKPSAQAKHGPCSHELTA